MSASLWRERARRAITGAITHRMRAADRVGRTPSVAGLLEAVDQAYPFGERARLPYRIWLEERARAADYIARLLGDGSPLRRACRSCGARPGRACRRIGQDDRLTDYHAARVDGGAPGPLFGGA